MCRERGSVSGDPDEGPVTADHGVHEASGGDESPARTDNATAVPTGVVVPQATVCHDVPAVPESKTLDPYVPGETKTLDSSA
jgi:hypothetical protein